jgi:hypothetical protein
VSAALVNTIKKPAGDLRVGDVIIEGSRTTHVRYVERCGRRRPGLHVNGNLCFNAPEALVLVKVAS